MSDILKGYGQKKIVLDVRDIGELNKLIGKLIPLNHVENIDFEIINEIIKRYRDSKL